MERIYAKARAKINLNLEVLNKREDNYHNIKSVFQKINLYDEIYIEKTNNNILELCTNIEELNNEKNIIYKAYVKLCEKHPISGAKVILNKKIPMQAGLGGGSADCASFILGMNRLFDLKLSQNELKDIGKSLGADVVPCFYNRALVAEGIGDQITEIDTNFKYYVVIVKASISCNTKEMYSRIDTINRTNIDTTEQIIRGLENSDLEQIAMSLHNEFEEVMQEKEMIQTIKQKLLENGAMGSAMTGSGSSVFGLFDEKEKALHAYRKLKDSYESFVCTSFNHKRTLKEFKND